jgi:hypothetical protein
MTPLPGEDILVRRLADAAAQAVEKGLAVKVSVWRSEVAWIDADDTFAHSFFF